MVEKEEAESQKKIVTEHGTEKDSKDEQGKQRILQEGEVIVFPKEMSEPFGIGRVMGTESKEGTIPMAGNTTFNPRGTFLPGWLDPVDRKFYFQPMPRSKKHTEFMGKDEGVQVAREEVIAHGFRVLTDANRLSMNARTVITSSKEVEQMFKKRDKTERKEPVLGENRWGIAILSCFTLQMHRSARGRCAETQNGKIPVFSYLFPPIYSLVLVFAFLLLFFCYF
jgi:hypothetical protein